MQQSPEINAKEYMKANKDSVQNVIANDWETICLKTSFSKFIEFTEEKPNTAVQ